MYPKLTKEMWILDALGFVIIYLSDFEKNDLKPLGFSFLIFKMREF